jgi:hypothetical protein
LLLWAVAVCSSLYLQSGEQKERAFFTSAKCQLR